MFHNVPQCSTMCDISHMCHIMAHVAQMWAPHLISRYLLIPACCWPKTLRLNQKQEGWNLFASTPKTKIYFRQKMRPHLFCYSASVSTLTPLDDGSDGADSPAVSSTSEKVVVSLVRLLRHAAAP